MPEIRPPKPIWDPAPPWWWWCRIQCWDPPPPWIEWNEELEKRFAQLEIDFRKRELEIQIEQLGVLEKMIIG